MSENRKVVEAKALLKNKLLQDILNDLYNKEIKDWQGQSDIVKQGAIWHHVQTITRVRDSVRRACEQTIKSNRTDTDGE